MAGNYISWTDNATTTTYGSGASSGDYYAWQGEWDAPGTTIYQPITTIREIIKEKVVTKEVEQRTLYRVYIVDPRKGGEILMDGKPVIAKNENQAMLKAGIAEVANKVGRDIEQLDVYVEEVGTFIRPMKETQKVKIIKEEED